MEIADALTATPDGVLLRVKVVPGARRTRLMGMLGDRLKVAVAAPPEAGKANAAVCLLLANLLKLPARDVTVTAGPTNPQKTIELRGASLCSVAEALQRTMG